VKDRSVIDIHIRISRTLLIWIAVVMVIGFVLPFLLATLGGRSSADLKIGPVQTAPNP
jgi:hypothetical protein